VTVLYDANTPVSSPSSWYDVHLASHFFLGHGQSHAWSLFLGLTLGIFQFEF
jgi:hypothetical protein